MKHTVPDEIDLRWDDIQLFLALAREKSLTAGAKRLGLDTSTASRRLVKLEEQLGRRLFERTRDGLVATHAALRMLPAAEEMEAGMKHLTSTAGAIAADIEGVVRIACSPGLADHFVGPMLAELRARHPALAFEIDAGVRPVDLAHAEADLALRSIRPESAELVVVKLLASRWILCASPERAVEWAPVRAWNDVPWILWGRELDHIPVAHWAVRHLRGITPVLRTSSMGCQLGAVQSGLGVALLPTEYVERFGLAPVKTSSKLAAEAAEWPVDDLFLVCHRSVRSAPRVAAVWDHLVATLQRR
jgi:DNA-binding transcriptional LysR family regulator